MKRFTPLLAMLLPGLAWAGVVWRGDFETGTTGQYTRAQQVSANRLQVVQSPVGEGHYALKATVYQGDDPIDSSGNRNELVYMGGEAEGAEYYYHWKVLFASDFPSAKTWQVFTQWHHTGSSGSPPVEFFVYGEEMRLTLTDSATPWKAKLERGVWQDFVLHMKWSANPAVGEVELWHNGKQVLSHYKHANLYEGQGVYLKLGLYRSDTVQPVGVVYHDAFTQATQLVDVLPTPAPPPADGGTPPPPADAGTPDAGAPEPREEEPSSEEPPPLTATSPAPNAGAVSPSSQTEMRVGCSSAGESLWAMALLSLGGLLRRVRRR